METRTTKTTATTTLSCGKCGAAISFDHNFCPTCGSKVKTKDDASQIGNIPPPDDGLGPEEDEKEAEEKRVVKEEDAEEKRIVKEEEEEEKEKKNDPEETKNVDAVTSNEMVIKTRSRMLNDWVRSGVDLLIETPPSTSFAVVFRTLSLCSWVSILIVAVFYAVKLGLSERCGWEGGTVTCYPAVWEKIARVAVPIVVASILTIYVERVLDMVSSSRLGSNGGVTNLLTRCVGRPVVLIGVIGFDAMHHLNRTFRYFSTTLFLITWAVSESLLFADKISATTGLLKFARYLHMHQDRFLSPVLQFSEFAVLCTATFGSPRRVFRYPLVDTSTHLWQEEEGIGSFPVHAIALFRVVASVYALWVGYRTARGTGSFVKRHFIERSKTSGGRGRRKKQKKKKGE